MFMCPHKEPDFFNGTGRFTSQEYEALFDGARAGQAAGEASVGYLHSVQAPARIKKAIPHVRLLAVLRDPADRAFSHYNMMIAHGAVPNRPYLDVLREARRTGNYHNTGIPLSRYGEFLRRYFDVFDEEQLRIYRYEHYKRDPVKMVCSIFEYIGVNPAYLPDVTRRHNKTYRPRSNRLNRFVWGRSGAKAVAQAVLPSAARNTLSQLLQRANRSPVPPLAEEARAIIIEVLRDDIERTEALLGCDLADWKQV